MYLALYLEENSSLERRRKASMLSAKGNTASSPCFPLYLNTGPLLRANSWPASFEYLSFYGLDPNLSNASVPFSLCWTAGLESFTLLQSACILPCPCKAFFFKRPNANPQRHPLQQVKCLHRDLPSGLSSAHLSFIVNSIPISAGVGSSLLPGHLPSQCASQPAAAWRNSSATLRE